MSLRIIFARGRENCILVYENDAPDHRGVLARRRAGDPSAHESTQHLHDLRRRLGLTEHKTNIDLAAASRLLPLALAASHAAEAAKPNRHNAMSISRHKTTNCIALSATLGFALLCGAAMAGNKNEVPWGDAPAGKEYVYKTSAGRERKMEIYFPPNHDPAKAKVPGLILLHGGGWSGGKLDQFRPACAYFASRGLVCATAEYQMIGKEQAAKLPKSESKKRVCVTDAKSAIRWFKHHSAELGIDPKRIITGGGSAGGHISALATMNPGLNDPTDSKDIDTSVVAYLWFNPAFSPDDSSDAEIDIMKHMQKDIAPSIVFFGDKDEWKKGWDTAHARWREMGVTNIDLRIAEGEEHSFFNRKPWRAATLIEADKFLVGLGLLAGEPTMKAPATGEKLVPAHP